ncbi:dynamin [Geobacillus stearothermophilus]|uniref:dynamin family protein n=1 Tax=Geobacillus stearothermophilus TaxID=1422 RepID=UPI000EF49FF4|nr:dynamin [Geobacillus stearothermophilus]
MTNMHDRLQQAGDNENADKVKQLIEKTAAGELVIAFCGHFSAGKSSLINALLGEPLLPSSPIPTSANLVKVKAGLDCVRVFYHDDPPVEYEPPYDPELIRAQCRDGETIEWIEISRETGAIPPGVAILDTPGIDSTDDAHRLATESALHLADVVFYVMDYNHVQAELNFQFTKQLTDEGKIVYLVVKQIDKHREDELPFAAFRASAAEAFRRWGVEAARLFFLSLKDPAHPENEWQELMACLRRLVADEDEWLLRGAEAGLRRIAARHLEQLRARHELLEQEFKARLEALGGAGSEAEAMQELGRLEAELADWQTARVEEAFRAELDRVLQNAYLMPFETRERAEAYLQAMQPNFKVGLLFAKTKTEQERERRLEAFYESVKAQAAAQIEWHVRQLLLRFGNEWHADGAWLGQCQQWTADWDQTLLSSLVKQGAEASGAALLNYTDEVAMALKKRYHDAALALFAGLAAQIAERAAAQAKALEGRLSAAREKAELIARLAGLKAEEEERQRALERLIAASGDEVVLDEERLAALTAPPHFQKVRHAQAAERPATTEPAVNHPAAQEQALSREAVEGAAEESADGRRALAASGKQRSDEAADRLEEAAAWLERTDLLRRFVGPLRDKARRLRERAFTVALFGAFSAGKSSLANALLGAPLLPSSPNPTTAAISKIAPPDREHPHGTAVVKVKDEAQIWANVQASLRQFGCEAKSWDEALRHCARLAESGAERPAQKPHLAFLAAAAAGYERMKNRFGTRLSIGFAELEAYVADEAVSCFLDEVVLYADCPLTRQGVTLVDTPGVDSLNARHTGVAFHYMKHADALLFVTYYNHAFSKADREFLLQLGRVKDAFSLDKMFFIINAADLAQSKEELEAVISYMNGELARFGIRFPRLYALSSRLALAEKTGAEPGPRGVLADSGLSAFETDFFRFLTEELAEVAVESAYAELERARRAAEEFARDEKRRMKEEIEAALVEPIDAYLAEQKERLVATYAEQYKAAVAALLAALAEQVDSYMEGLLAALAEAADHEALARIEAALRGLLSGRVGEAR